MEANGAVALKPKERGKKQGEGRSLTAAREDKIRKLIPDKAPERLKMGFAPRTRAAVMLSIERECAIKLSVRTVGNYLKRWGFTPQKPIKRAHEQRPEPVKQWLDEEYPAIEKRAKAEGGEIHWGDETALVNTDVLCRGYAPKGQTPLLRGAVRNCR
jgi:transposase